MDEISQITSYLYLTSWYALTDIKQVNKQLDDILEISKTTKTRENGIGSNNNNNNNISLKNIISIMEFSPSDNWYQQCFELGINTEFYEIDDQHHITIINIAKQIHDKIMQIKNANGIVIIHCRAGISRSATCVLFHLLQLNRDCWQDDYTKYSTVDLEIDNLRRIRPIIDPNYGFKRQLDAYFKIPDET